MVYAEDVAGAFAAGASQGVVGERATARDRPYYTRPYQADPLYSPGKGPKHLNLAPMGAGSFISENVNEGEGYADFGEGDTAQQKK